MICDGCNVREPFEHRCHRENIVVRGERTRHTCACEECREVEDYMRRWREEHAENLCRSTTG